MEELVLENLENNAEGHDAFAKKFAERFQGRGVLRGLRVAQEMLKESRE